MGWAVMMSMKQAVDGPDWKISPAGKIDIEHADLYRWDVDFLTGPAWVRFCRPISPKSIQEQWNRLDYRFCIKKRENEWSGYCSIEASSWAFFFIFPFCSFFKQDVTLLYCLFYSKGVRTLQNGHHAVLKKNWDHLKLSGKVFIKVINQVRNKVIFPMDFYIIWLLFETRRSTECTDFIFLT